MEQLSIWSEPIQPICVLESPKFNLQQEQLALKLIALISKYDPALAVIKLNTAADINELIKRFEKIYPAPQMCSQDKVLSISLTSLITQSNFDDSLTCSVEDVLLSFDGKLDQGLRKKSGSFYTPVSLCDLIIDQALAAFNSSNSWPKTLEPACGSGIFLVRLINKLFVTKQQPPSLLTEWLNKKVTAVDINSEALIITWLGIIAKIWELASKNPDSLSTTDQILIRNTQPKLSLSNFLLHKIQNDDNHEDFELIIGNPPYGLSRDQQIDVDENSALKNIYDYILCGKPNKYMLFIARAYELLNKNGVMAFVVPNSWLGVKSAQKLRELLLKNDALYSITHFKKNLFEDAQVEAVISIITKNQGENINVTCYEGSDSTKSIESFEVSPRVCESILNSRIPLVWSTQASTILSDVFSSCKRLEYYSDFFKPLIALQPYALGKGSPAQTKEVVKSHPFHHTQPVDKNCIPYLEGRDISAYSIRWSGKYLSYGPWLAEYQNVERYKGARIILREILGKYPYLLIGTFSDKTLVYNKSCLHILSGAKASTQLIKALLGILNSSLAGYIILHTGCKSQRRLFPKIVKQDLDNFPIPEKLFTESRKLSLLVEQALDYTANKASDLEGLRNDIDREVLNLYNLRENILTALSA